MLKSRISGFSFGSRLFALSCFGLLAASAVTLTGCSSGPSATKKEVKKEVPLQMQVVQVDQLSQLAKKAADGQFLVAKMTIKNVSNKPIELSPSQFALEYITEKEAERYSQPPERRISRDFSTAYGKEAKEKLMDASTDINPRIELERFFVFMVPSDAKANQYQIVYTAAKNDTNKINVPLVTPGTTVVNDHRSEYATSTSYDSTAEQ